VTTTREMILVGGVVKALRGYHSWTGETHIQKTIFIAKHQKAVPFESEFVLYKHGPFSFDLSKSIVHMRSRGLLSTEANPGYGPSFSTNETLWLALDKTAGELYEEYSNTIDEVAKILAPKNVSELERITTAIYVENMLKNSDEVSKIAELRRIKPHISMELAEKAFVEAKVFQ